LIFSRFTLGRFSFWQPTDTEFTVNQPVEQGGNLGSEEGFHPTKAGKQYPVDIPKFPLFFVVPEHHIFLTRDERRAYEWSIQASKR
jgi:hypothetical protein